jgi:hypothetical protein
VHLLCSTGNRINRAGLDAQGAADADVFIDKGDGFGFGRGGIFAKGNEIPA